MCRLYEYSAPTKRQKHHDETQDPTQSSCQAQARLQRELVDECKLEPVPNAASCQMQTRSYGLISLSNGSLSFHPIPCGHASLHHVTSGMVCAVSRIFAVKYDWSSARCSVCVALLPPTGVTFGHKLGEVPSSCEVPQSLG